MIPKLTIVFHMGTNARDLDGFALSVAAELRAEAARQHISVRALANIAGMPHSTLSKSLTGSRVIDVSELAKICGALAIEPAEIFRRASPSQSTGGRVTQIRPNDSGYLDDALKGLDTAAGTDETQADEDD